MRTNRHKPGNMAVLVNAPRPGLRNFDDVIEARAVGGRGGAGSGLSGMGGW